MTVSSLSTPCCFETLSLTPFWLTGTLGSEATLFQLLPDHLYGEINKNQPCGWGFGGLRFNNHSGNMYILILSHCALNVLPHGACLSQGQRGRMPNFLGLKPGFPKVNVWPRSQERTKTRKPSVVSASSLALFLQSADIWTPEWA